MINYDQGIGCLNTSEFLFLQGFRSWTKYSFCQRKKERGLCMGRGRFTEEEMDRLLQNPYVTDVNRTSISYSREFKQLFMGEYTAGRRPVQIFRDAGFDIDMLGSKRIERACARWKESYESGTLGSREAVCIKEKMGKSRRTTRSRPKAIRGSL